MDPEAPPSNDYMIFHPEKARLIDILSLLIRKRRLTSYRFVEGGGGNALGDAPTDQWVVALTILVQKVLSQIQSPMQWLGYIVEFIINLLALNGGILRLLWHIITVSVVFPKRDTAEFRSMIGHIDGRLDLYKKSSSLISYPSVMDSHANLALDTSTLDLTIMASKIAYENAAYIENAVTNHWKMHFVKFFNCWNKYLEEKTTQAFIFCNKEEDADLIVVAFRGTEPFNAQDWSTDVDLSWMFMGLKMGHVHLGFLKALGLQDTTNASSGFPKDYSSSDEDKPVAYYAIREELKNLLKQHKNAKIIVTGHSLGGALAAIFPALLAMHNQNDVLAALSGVMTYGQPRVGDAIFGIYLQTIMRVKHYRMVYRYDIVPRIPFDVPPVALFKHFGNCIYYNGWLRGQEVVNDVPNPNYFDPMHMIPMYWYAWGDLFGALFIGITQGQEFREGYVSILYRACGLILPGIASHSPRDYVNAVRLAKMGNKIMV